MGQKTSIKRKLKMYWTKIKIQLIKLCERAKTMLRGVFIELSTNIRNEEWSKINNPGFYF